MTREQDDTMSEIRELYERITLPGDMPFVAAVDIETYVAGDGLRFEAEASVSDGHNDIVAVFADAGEAVLYAVIRNAYVMSAKQEDDERIKLLELAVDILAQEHCERTYCGGHRGIAEAGDSGPWTEQQWKDWALKTAEWQLRWRDEQRPSAVHVVSGPIVDRGSAYIRDLPKRRRTE
ncbi:MAG: hypothetical protein ABFC80_03825 [Coriobacteriales bacterium]